MSWIIYYLIASAVAAAFLAWAVRRNKIRTAYHMGCARETAEIATYTDAEYDAWCDGRRGEPFGTAAQRRRALK